MTNDSSVSNTSLSNARCIASCGDTLHVVWYDHRSGNWEIFYNRSTNAGTNWGTDTRLTTSTSLAEYPSIAISGSFVHIVWELSGDIYYKRSTNGGVNWGQAVKLSNNPYNSNNPSIAVSGLAVHVVWDENFNSHEILYRRSTDGGVNWGTDSAIANSPTYASVASMSLSGTVVHVVWYDSRNFLAQVYYKQSTDGGINWGAETRLSNTTYSSVTPSISSSGQFVHVAWADSRNGDYKIYYKRSTNGGLNWSADTRLTFDVSISKKPSLVVSGSNVHITYEDVRNGDVEIYYLRSTNGGLNWEQLTRLTNSYGDSWKQSVSVSGSAVYVIWSDSRNGNYEIYFKRNPTGNITGIVNINSEIPSSYSLSQNYPNPFNNTSNFKFEISNLSDVKIIVYDIQGREVQTLVNERLQPGTYETTFDGTNLNSGVYFYKLTAGDFSETKRMVLIK